MRTFEDLFEEYMRTPGLLASARKAQVAALLIQSTRPRGLLYRHPVTFNGTSATIPVAIASRETSERLMRLREHGPVRVRLTISNRTGGPYKSRNVIAEIRGREKPDEIVLLGAHLDSWELGTGAEDNGVNAAMVIDVARGFRQLGLVPRRTVRFALFTGEEQGLWGSAGYVKSHASELDGHVCAVIFDTGSGRTSGFLLSGREELRAPVNAALSAVSGLGAGEQAPDAFDGTDNFDFLLSGVPNLIANQDAVPYLPDYHAESDTYDKTNAREAAANEAIASVLIWGLAESPQRMAPRLSKAQTEKLISDTKLEEQMRAFGHWDDWRSGKRGVAKTGN
jgi:Zn-dependent M28 family amino/carboxypeptidase